MYKIFINEKLLILSDRPQSGIKNLKYDNIHVFDIGIDLLKNSSTEKVNIFYHNLNKLWTAFCHQFKYLEAAGGVVENENKELLFIFRHQKWDLPKGKVEPNEPLEETAIREVEEECSIFDLKIKDFLITTYHVYFENQYILKATHWYEMHYSGKDLPKPQKEEGIQKAEWIGKDDLDSILINTFKNIELVLLTYFEKKSMI